MFPTYIFLIFVMAMTAPFCESTIVSYIPLLLSLLFIRHKEYLVVLILFSDAVFYRIAPGIPFSIIVILLYTFSVLLKEKVYKRKWTVNGKAITLITAAIAFLFYSCYTSITGSYDDLAKFVSFAILMYISTYDKSCDLGLLQKIFYYTSLIGVIIVVFHMFVHPTITIEGRRTLSALHNANVTARGLAVMVIITYLYKNCSFRGLTGIIKAITIFLGLVALFLTGSRMGLVATLATIFACFYLGTKNKSQFFTYVTSGIILLLMALPLLSFMDIDLGRFEGGFSQESITGNVRIVSSMILWKKAISENPFTGVGLGNINSEYILGYVPDADNMYIDLLTQLGIIGFVFTLVLVTSTLKRLFKYKRTQNIPFYNLAIPISLILLQIPLSFTESVFDELAIWYAIAISNIFINANKYNGAIGINYRSKL